jgi:branched-chain amino acid transport system ATP-binding protein
VNVLATPAAADATRAEPALQVAGLSAWYGAAQALFDVSLTLAAGEVLALVGRNGAGKSTLLKAVMGVVTARGSLRLDGQGIDVLPPHARARAGLGWVPEDRRIFTELSVRENLQVGSRGQPLGLEELLTLFPNLREMLDRPAAQMSGGEQQMLAVARTLAGRPRVVLLDEPSEGIAPIIVQAMAQAVRQMKAQGVAVLLSEQNARFVAAVADRALLIADGRLVGEVAPADLHPPAPAVRAVLGL